MYDVTNIESFRLIENFSQMIEQVRLKSLSLSLEQRWIALQTGLDLERRYLIANKIDLVEDRKIDEEVGQRVRNYRPPIFVRIAPAHAIP